MAKLIGLIGGMSWESTEIYCRRLNELANQARGGHHAANFLVYSVDFGEVEAMQSTGRWKDAADLLIDAARRLERSGVDEIILCTNTMHIVAEEIESSIGTPFLHIADATGRHLVAAGIQKAGLLATKYTMEEEFYKNRLLNNFGLEILIPNKDDRIKINEIIYSELCHGVVTDASKGTFAAIGHELMHSGAQGVILGCTEIGMLLKDGDLPIPIFDSALIHADEASKAAFEMPPSWAP